MVDTKYKGSIQSIYSPIIKLILSSAHQHKITAVPSYTTLYLILVSTNRLILDINKSFGPDKMSSCESIRFLDSCGTVIWKYNRLGYKNWPSFVELASSRWGSLAADCC